MFLGLLIATLVHAGIEMLLLKIIFSQPDAFADSYLWKEWKFVHWAGGLVIWILGFLFGFWGGLRYWKIIYVDKRYGEKKW